MATDARICVGLPSHPKTKKLIRRLGVGGAWSLVCLILWVAANRSDGQLTGLSDEDIELAAEWGGDEGAFVRELVNVRYLDGVADGRAMHDWAEHNPWAAGADMRSAKARWNAAKRHHGYAEADRQVPEYAAIRNAGTNDTDATSNTSSNASSMHAASTSIAPSPSPSPSPSPTPTLGGECASEAPPDPSAVASPPPIFSQEARKFIATERPDLDGAAVWRNFCDHYPAEKCTAAAWRKWVRREMRGPVPGVDSVPAAAVSDPDSKASVEAVGLSVGLGRWDQLKEPWAAYKSRVKNASSEPVQ